MEEKQSQERAKTLIPAIAEQMGIPEKEAAQVLINAYYSIGSRTLTDEDDLSVFGATQKELFDE